MPFRRSPKLSYSPTRRRSERARRIPRLSGALNRWKGSVRNEKGAARSRPQEKPVRNLRAGRKRARVLDRLERNVRGIQIAPARPRLRVGDGPDDRGVRQAARED